MGNGLTEIDQAGTTAYEREGQVVKFGNFWCNNGFRLFDYEGVDDVEFFAHDVSFQGLGK